MISGIATTLSLLLPLASPAAPEPAVADAAATQLVERLKRPLPAHTAYTEVRFVQMLDAPLVLRGELDYPRADELGKTVTEPYRETTTIAAGQVVTERPGKPAKKFSLKRAPALAGFLESFTATLGGDAARLAQSYVLQAQDGPHWQLDLVPRDPALAKHVKRVRISGEAATPLCFEVEESGGDSSILLVDRLAAAPLPATPQREQLQQLCRGTP